MFKTITKALWDHKCPCTRTVYLSDASINPLSTYSLRLIKCAIIANAIAIDKMLNKSKYICVL